MKILFPFIAISILEITSCKSHKPVSPDELFFKHVLKKNYSKAISIIDTVFNKEPYKFHRNKDFRLYELKLIREMFKNNDYQRVTVDSFVRGDFVGYTVNYVRVDSPNLIIEIRYTKGYDKIMDFSIPLELLWDLSPKKNLIIDSVIVPDIPRQK